MHGNDDDSDDGEDDGDGDGDGGNAKIIRSRPHRLVAMARWQSFGVICMAMMMIVMMVRMMVMVMVMVVMPRSSGAGHTGW